MIEFRNLANKHDIILWHEDDIIRRIPYSGTTTRIKFEWEEHSKPNGIPCVYPVMNIVDLPVPQHGVINIVSNLVASVVKRPDCLAPDTQSDSSKITDGKNNIVAARRLISYTREVWK
jgi:hypothetical protein